MVIYIHTNKDSHTSAQAYGKDFLWMNPSDYFTDKPSNPPPPKQKEQWAILLKKKNSWKGTEPEDPASVIPITKHLHLKHLQIGFVHLWP